MNALLLAFFLCFAAVQTTTFKKCVPQNGGFSDWLKWSPCSVSCGSGTRTRHRYCDNPIPKYGGAKCKEEDSVQSETCEMGPCPETGVNGEYEKVGTCSKPCGGGTIEIQRKCLPPTNPTYTKCYHCPTDREESTETCNTHSCQPEVGNECQGCKRQANYEANRLGKSDFVGHACRTSNKFCEGRKKGIRAMYAQNDWFFLHCAPDGSWCKPCATRGLVYNPECGNCEVKRSGVKCTDAGTWNKKVHDPLRDEELW